MSKAGHQPQSNYNDQNLTPQVVNDIYVGQPIDFIPNSNPYNQMNVNQIQQPLYQPIPQQNFNSQYMLPNQQQPFMNNQMGPQGGYQNYQQPQQMYINHPQAYLPAQQTPKVQFQLREFKKDVLDYQCYHCGESIKTVVTRNVTQTQYLWCVVGGLVFLPLCFIPFLVDDCYKYHHHCPKCNGKIGSSANE
ncbi:UNKNOWN [Stylonychia lemnae]|uniref:LITAF domain-containing protein n=1 Tax=Stylonychia lemnae TaxID=5949 RepID=A0A078AI58_STYLE|nr:UNKNOWN [Stylonychia lemnae]|eukprot:CDW81889.1 UNKNOWN [Stylonychia lemnae]